MNFKNNFNKFKQHGEYFKGLDDGQIQGLLDGASAKISANESLAKETRDVSSDIIGAVKQSAKFGSSPKNINVKKLKKALSDLKSLLKSELSGEDKQNIELMVGLTELFIDNNASARNW